MSGVRQRGETEVVRFLADTIVTCDNDFTVFDQGAIDVADGRISFIGAIADAPEHSGEVVKLGGLMMPGLVNTHAHTPMTLVRGGGDGLPLMRWLTEVMWPREGQMTPDDVRWGMTLGSIEMLRAGVTTSCEMYLFEEAVAAGAQDIGIRLVMTPAVLAALHADTFGAESSRVDAIADFHGRMHDPTGTLTVGFAPHSAYDLGLGYCGELAAAARDLDALLHIHVAETRDEGSELEAAHGGRSTVQLLAEAGVLGGRVLAAHSVWLDEADIELYADLGVAVAHCPVSNMKLGSGTARVPEMRSRGITVGLGTDGPASNDDLDLWQELKLAPLLARVTALDAAVMGPRDTLSMATREGATALGLDEVGSLEVGNRADMIRLDIDDPAFIPVTAPEELVSHLVWSAGARHVTDVWVQGRQVVRDRICITVDEQRARHEGRARGLRLARDSGT